MTVDSREQSPRPAKRRRRNSSYSDDQTYSARSEGREDKGDRSAGTAKQRRHGSPRNHRGYKDRRDSRRSKSPESSEDEDIRSRRRRNSKDRSSRRDRSRQDRDQSRSRSRERRYKDRYNDDGDRNSRHSRKHRDHSPLPKSYETSPRRRGGDEKNNHYDDHDSNQRKQIQPYERSKRPLPSQKDAFSTTATPGDGSALDKPLEKQKPNFGLTGKLAAASNTIQTGNQTIVLKYHEPPEARKPALRDQWRMYVFKGDEIIETVELSEQSCWLFGREVAVADFPIEHPSCSKQHAVVQFRYVDKKNEFGDRIGKVKPYVIDLESANGTSVNDEAIPAAQYVELRDKDVIKFGHSSREYMVQLPPKT